MKKTSLPILLLAAALLLGGCVMRPAASAAPAAAPTAVPAATAEPTAAPTPAPTPEPTPTPSPTPVPTPVPPAEQAVLTVKINGQDVTAQMDGNNRTVIKIPASAAVTVTADRPVAGLYIRWQDYPQPYELRTEGGDVLQCGVNAFLHEYVALPSPSAEMTIYPPAAAELNIVYGFTPGYLPEWVQLWQPPCERADILVVPTHADDEFIFFGGVIPTYVAKGYRVQVAYMVHHHTWERHRLHEQLDGLWEAGVTNYPMIGPKSDDIATGDLSIAHWYYDAIFEPFQVELIRRFRPLVIVDHAENGEYGHGAHQLNTMMMKSAVLSAADPAKYPDTAEKYGVWDTPKLYLHVYGPEDEQTVLDFETPLEQFGGRDAYQVAVDAFAWHLSQQQWEEFGIFTFGSEYDTHRFGLYRSTVGPDEAKNDLFEHIDMAAMAQR